VIDEAKNIHERINQLLSIGDTKRANKLLLALSNDNSDLKCIDPSVDLVLPDTEACLDSPEPKHIHHVYQTETPREGSEIRHFCTYFDWSYTAKGVAMVESLMSVDFHHKVHLLALDELSRTYLKQRFPKASVYSVSDLITSNIILEKTLLNRSQVDGYFTLTSALLNFLLSNLESDAVLTYLDADLYFYKSLEPLYEELKHHSALIIEHNFSASLKHLGVHGRFNVGWISIRNNSIGLEIVSDYKDDCIRWCHDRLEGPLYADQKYLDYWPLLYSNIRISKCKEANVAPWNISGRTLDFQGESPTIDGRPILFYHFSGLKRNSEGIYFIKNDYPYPDTDEFRWFYGSYVRVLQEVEKQMVLHAPLSTENIRV
jgi:hypothetical protein